MIVCDYVWVNMWMYAHMFVTSVIQMSLFTAWHYRDKVLPGGFQLRRFRVLFSFSKLAEVKGAVVEFWTIDIVSDYI